MVARGVPSAQLRLARKSGHRDRVLLTNLHDASRFVGWPVGFSGSATAELVVRALGE
jgi:hypothetical protein